MTVELVKSFLKQKGIYDLNKSRQMTEVAIMVSQIPWGEGRTVEEVLSTKKVGTCTGKHLVLQACLDELGIKYAQVVCTFRWGDQPIRYPESLRRILNEGEWEHGHNFVQIERNGSKVDLDITWNPELAQYGFLSLPSDWNGETSFVGVTNIIRRWDGADIGTMKKKLIESLDPATRERRERFLKTFIAWVAKLNKR